MFFYLFFCLLVVGTSGQWGYGYPYGGMGMNMDPYGMGMNPMMSGMMNPMMMGGAGMCMDMSMQCPIWASTGQCATNPLYMQRTCGRSCGTCMMGMGMGMGMGYGLGMYGGTLGRSIYETGILRAPPKTAIFATNGDKSPQMLLKEESMRPKLF